MLLRSSSTPQAHSSFSDTPIRDVDHNNYPPSDHHTSKLSFSHGLAQHHPNLTSSASHCASQFSEPSTFRYRAFRRAFSDGNLEGLGYTCSTIDEFRNPITPRNSFCKHNKTMLQTSPSFSIFDTSGSGDEFQDEESAQQDPSEKALKRTVTIGESIEGVGSGEFSFGKRSMSSIEEVKEEEEEGTNGVQNRSFEEAENRPVSPRMYLATGLGIDMFGAGVGIGGFDGVDLSVANFDGGGDVEEYYKRMVDEYPCHPLFLRNYAHVLQSKGDLQGAEEYYSRATLADPEDGEILLQYAKFVWERNRDQDKAFIYFQRAAQVAPQDSHILAAFASFLWEIEDEKEEDEAHQDHIQIEEGKLLGPSLHIAAGLGTDVAYLTADESGEGGNFEEYYKKMVEENPNNPLFLRNYAQFLCQSKGDLRTAEDFFMRAILADPGDGEIMSLYAKLVWELHHDKDKASCYFERAVLAAPGDSNVLAAYACFLWEADDEEEGDEGHDCIQMPLLHEQAMKAANA